MGDILIIALISGVISAFTTIVISVNRNAKKITPEERERLKRNIDITIDV